MKRQYITLLLTLALAAASCKKAEPVILMYETEPLSADEVFFGIPKGSAFCSGQDGFADDGGETTEETIYRMTESIPVGIYDGRLRIDFAPLTRKLWGEEG